MKLATLTSRSLLGPLQSLLPAAEQSTKAPLFLLAGDSSTAIGGGWGDGFLNHTLQAPATGQNHGEPNATTVSYRAGGLWGSVLSEIQSHFDANNVYVTIEFGHNDQKPDSNISLPQFSQNLGAFVDEVRHLGAEPILVTSLTRRDFSADDPPRIVQSLADQRNATIAVAEATETMWIDLNLASEEYCNAIGPEASWKYNLVNETSQGDTTQLNEWGATVFGRLVSDLLNEKYGSVFGGWTLPDVVLSGELEGGVPA